MITGFDVGVRGMRLTEKRFLYVPSRMAYGKKGARGKIPPWSYLFFEVTLAERGIKWAQPTSSIERKTEANKNRKEDKKFKGKTGAGNSARVRELKKQQRRKAK